MYVTNAQPVCATYVKRKGRKWGRGRGGGGRVIEVGREGGGREG